MLSNLFNDIRLLAKISRFQPISERHATLLLFERGNNYCHLGESGDLSTAETNIRFLLSSIFLTSRPNNHLIPYAYGPKGE